LPTGRRFGPEVCLVRHCFTLRLAAGKSIALIWRVMAKRKHHLWEVGRIGGSPATSDIGAAGAAAF
jgi:hypothetical protein